MASIQSARFGIICQERTENSTRRRRNKWTVTGTRLVCSIVGVKYCVYNMVIEEGVQQEGTTPFMGDRVKFLAQEVV